MKGIVVQKFGGSSVATEALRERVIHHIERVVREGYHPVVVVSAMGRVGDPYATDTLLGLVESVGSDSSGRELDLLLACGEVISTVVLAQTLKSRGHVALALTGAQAGIVTDDRHGDARIVRIESERIKKALDEECIPIIAGFQGRSEQGEVTTLGRGGSDTTAAALAVELEAELLEVYTDVDGVNTADPRVAPEAATIERATYREVAEMAHLGARVIHPRAVEIAMNGQVKVKIRPTASDAPGTLVCEPGRLKGVEGAAADRPVTGIAHVSDRAQVVVEPPGESGEAAVRIFQGLGEASISADMIYVSPRHVAFIVEGKAVRRMETFLQSLGWPYSISSGLAKVSAVGAGMHGVPGIMARVAMSLYKAGVPILQTTDSHANISCLVPGSAVQNAVNALHREFGLGVTADAMHRS